MQPRKHIYFKYIYQGKKKNSNEPSNSRSEKRNSHRDAVESEASLQHQDTGSISSQAQSIKGSGVASAVAWIPPLVQELLYAMIVVIRKKKKGISFVSNVRKVKIQNNPRFMKNTTLKAIDNLCLYQNNQPSKTMISFGGDLLICIVLTYIRTLEEKKS